MFDASVVSSAQRADDELCKDGSVCCGTVPRPGRGANPVAFPQVTNRVRMATLLFDCAQSLLALCADKRRLGTKPGLLMAVHTWGLTLSHDPHGHRPLSAGGVDSAGQ